MIKLATAQARRPSLTATTLARLPLLAKWRRRHAPQVGFRQFSAKLNRFKPACHGQSLQPRRVPWPRLARLPLPCLPRLRCSPSIAFGSVRLGSSSCSPRQSPLVGPWARSAPQGRSSGVRRFKDDHFAQCESATVPLLKPGLSVPAVPRRLQSVEGRSNFRCLDQTRHDQAPPRQPR